MPWIDEGDGARSFFDVGRGIETVPPVIRDVPQISEDPYDALDDTGNFQYFIPVKPWKPEFPKGWWDPGTRPMPSPKRPQMPIPEVDPGFWQSPKPAPAAPVPITPENLIPPVEPKTWWDRITPGEGTTPGETFEKLPDLSVDVPKVDLGLAGMLPMLMVMMLLKDKE